MDFEITALDFLYPDGWNMVSRQLFVNGEKVSNTDKDIKVAELLAEYDAQEYARNRAVEYPAIGDQLDYIFHNGIAKWKTDMISPVKAKYPKPS